MRGAGHLGQTLEIRQPRTFLSMEACLIIIRNGCADTTACPGSFWAVALRLPKG